jgi:tripartite-type tricarboxylate transporter receptor subunit TctC
VNIINTMGRTLARLGLAATALACGASAWAAYPEKPIKIVVPFVAGIAPDAMARTIGEALSRRLNTPVLIDNRPGANGNIGTEFAARSAPDGYTLLVCGLTCSAAETFYRNLRFDMARDLEPVINIGTIPSVLVVAGNSPYKTLKDLTLDAKARPRQLSFASVGFGGSPHLAGELLKRAATIDILHVPYASSDPLLDVVGGRVSFMFIPGTAAAAQKSRLRPLAIASAQRDVGLPDVPTVAESGYPGFLMEPWNGLWAPKGTPPAILDLLNDTLQKVLAEPEIQAKLKPLGLTIASGTRQQMKQFFDADAKRWRDVGKANAITPQD